MLHGVRELTSYSIGALDGTIGRVRDVYFDDRRWAVRYFVVDTGRWLAGRRVLISPLSLCGITPEGKLLSASLTKAQVADSPDVDTEPPVSRQHELEFTRYYGLANYWMGDGNEVPLAEVAALAATDLEHDGTEESGDPHLRSAHAVMHYHVHARDGNIGHVADLLYDDGSWSIEHVVVATGGWWPGRKVLVPVAWADEVSWTTNSVAVGLLSEIIRLAPQYDASSPPSREYVGRLSAYYSGH